MSTRKLSAATSLRTFLEECKAEGDLVEIDLEVDPHLESGAISRRAYETGSPIPLINNPKGKDGPDGLFRILGAPVGVRSDPETRNARLAKSIGLPSNATGHDIIQKLLAAKRADPIPSVQVKDAPLKEHKIFGDKIDLLKMPVPQNHVHDGGRYFLTYGLHSVQTPDGKWVNWAITRCMVIGKRQLTGLVDVNQDIGAIWAMWKALGKDTPWACALGVPPAAAVASGMPLPKFVNEPDYVGTLTGVPVEVIKCETNDLVVPAQSELVLEGVISATETAMEGPMGEYHGLLFPPKKSPQPVMTVNAITYRTNPIVPISVAGRAPDETHTVWALSICAEILDLLQQANLPITKAWCPYESQAIWYVIQVDRKRLVEMKTAPEKFCRQVGEIVFSSKPGRFVPKIFVVGDNVDPSNLRDVVWAEATKSQPQASDFYFVGNYPTYDLVPYATHGFNPRGQKAKVVRLCMLPEEFETLDRPWVEASFRGSYPQEVKNKVLENWQAYGFEGSPVNF
ncbi:hypothetical protein DTO006G1_5500 [Penicillium roqueforti]|uniref:Ferulic acid decarboxylase 1 n=1 Tax=Penicillium roqueforti (strain FM164) TaxID=1365484 RepID=W6QAQ7_PENRF|nr:uncharacterized protein LCP9604111_9486 [Penicillium roqueforti]CDM33126.1 Carboxylyase-related [Penicillium roqueforti FM164]KAF9238282.1 hypothetical protein LCP9604111_9486 [Penicillium roqueforti]KAI1830845.1 hypothetical protein CBS147337_8462 [Penicillium roqueforti]KAI2683934.1 hypothetical protein LCP963914a_5764 [Penicillium roqueforti]KAI2759595.1 hypothetical protein DTO006G1_5500 [Penicillium roqueforti]